MAKVKDKESAKQFEDNVSGDRVVASLTDFLAECTRWGISVKDVLKLIEPATVEESEQWKVDADAAGLVLDIPEPPTWFELDDKKLGEDMPVEFEARAVVPVVDPGDPHADPPVAPTYDEPRPRKWSEAVLLLEREDKGKTRYFVPASNGIAYFNKATVDAIAANAAVLATLKPKDLPTPPPVPE